MMSAFLHRPPQLGEGEGPSGTGAPGGEALLGLVGGVLQREVQCLLHRERGCGGGGGRVGGGREWGWKVENGWTGRGVRGQREVSRRRGGNKQALASIPLPSPGANVQDVGP